MDTKSLVASLILLSLLFIFAPAQSAAAAETKIFSDDFESGSGNWELGDGWSIISDGGNHVLQGTQHTFATANVEGVANKLELRLKLLQGTVHSDIRSKLLPEGFNRYLIGLSESGSYIQKQVGDSIAPLSNGNSISPNEWHSIKIEIVQNKISVFSDGNLVVSAEDANLIKDGGASFEILDNSQAYIDDVRVESTVPEARQISAAGLFPNGGHKGDITLQGSDSLILENGNFSQFGNIQASQNAKLVIRNAMLKVSRYQKLLNHWGISLHDAASLEVINSTLIANEDTLLFVDAVDFATIHMNNSPTKVHLFEVGGHAKAVVEKSEIVGDPGIGSVGPSDHGDLQIVDSKIGSVDLNIPKGATFKASGLHTGLFSDWDLHRDTAASGINYNIRLINTELVPDMVEPGPNERSWKIFINSGANVDISDSAVRKIVIDMQDEKADFSDLKLNAPTNLQYKDINIRNVTVTGQWGVFSHGNSDVTVKNSDEMWAFIYGNSKLKLINTHLDEFDPRQFTGTIDFENSTWDTAAEIIDYNNFAMKGGVKIGDIGGFSWENSNVTREFNVAGTAGTALTLEKNGVQVWLGQVDNTGQASFSIQFDDSNFNDKWLLKDNHGQSKEIGFLSETPVMFGQEEASPSSAASSTAQPENSSQTFITVAIASAAVLLAFASVAILKKRKK